MQVLLIFQIIATWTLLGHHVVLLFVFNLYHGSTFHYDFSHIETMTKEDQITLYLKLAIIANNTDNLKAEIFALEKLSSLDLANLDLKINLAQKLTKQAFGIVTPNARDLVKNVLIKDPENLDALYLAGLAAKQNGRSDLATKIWEQIIKYNPQYKNIDLIKDELQQINKLN